jgi:sensor c-di-GMP phosphodiesterase-like protein
MPAKRRGEPLYCAIGLSGGIDQRQPMSHSEGSMRGRIAFALTTLAAVVALAAPPWLALRESQRQAYKAELDQVHRYALDVLHRVDGTTRQIDRAFDQLDQAGFTPCSAQSLALMRQIALGSSYLQAVGYIRNGGMVCSSMGGVPLELGTGAFRYAAGFTLYPNVPSRQPGQLPLMAAQRGQLAALIHRDLPVDAWTDMPGVSLGVLNVADGRVLIARGRIAPTWLRRLGAQHETSFTDAGLLVALLRSGQSQFVAVAAAPLARVDRRAADIARRLVPAGVIGGLIVSLAIMLLARRQLSMEAALRGALRRDEFFMCYQPIIRLETGEWVGAEALVRWRRADGTLVGPDLFIPVAEQSKLITRITERVLQLVAHDAGHFLAAHPAFHVALNLSAEDLHSARIVEQLGVMLARCGARPSNLIVELTERGFLNLSSAREVIAALREKGIEVAIDDFGTGYSSLSYLESLDLDFLKIDRSFIEAIGTGAPISLVVGHVITMARSMGLRTIAEGIESQAQAEFLRERGVEYAQGFLFGRPMPFAKLVQRFKEREHAARVRPAGAAVGP